MAISSDKPDAANHVEHSTTLAAQPTEKPRENPWSLIIHHPKLVLCALLANIGPLMFGFDLVVVGAISALPAFLRDFGQSTKAGLVLPAIWLGLWNGLVQAGAAAGSVCAGVVQDRIGRRRTFLLGGLLGVAGTTVAYTCPLSHDKETRRGLFLLAKILIGMGCGVLMSACQTYISEIAPKNLRGVLLGLYSFNVSLGHMLAMAIVFTQISNMSTEAYRIPFGTQWAFGGVAIVAAFVLPESPVWLVAQNKPLKAHEAVKKLGTDRDGNMVENIQTTLASEHDGQETPKFTECFLGIDLRRTLIVIWLNCLQQFVGISLISNGAYFLIMAGMSYKYSLMVNLIGIGADMIANMITWYTAPRFGRRTMILISIALDTLAWLAMGIAGCFSSPAANWFVGVALLLFGFFNSFGVASVVPIIASEISCVRLRSKTAGIGFGTQSLIFWVFSFFTPYLYNRNKANWGGKIGFFFAGLSVIAYIITWLVVPETRGRNFNDIDFLFKERIKAWAFSNTLVPSYNDGIEGNVQKETEMAIF